MGAARARSSIVRLLNLLTLVVLAWGLSGCAGGPIQDLLRGGGAQKQSVNLAPIIGAPAKVSKDLTTELNVAAEKRNIPVIAGGGATYTLQGYLATSPEGKGYKLAYIWDVTDKMGRRVHRILGEQLVPKKGANPWAGVDQQTVRLISAKTMSDLAEWLPKQAPPALSRPIAAATRRPGVTSSTGEPGEYFALVPSVKGAPGDGRKSLTLAIKKQLFNKGIKLASSKGSNVYTIAGNVKMGQPSDGMQSIAIEWQVSDPSGKNLGKVSQKNKIDKGALDRTWGKTADAAAAAAADGIIKLLPRRK